MKIFGEQSRRTFLRQTTVGTGAALLALSLPSFAFAQEEVQRGAALLPNAATGAQINERLVSVNYYVAPHGSDEASGTHTQPFRTIQHALNIALVEKARNVGVRVVIENGVYRESVIVPVPEGGDTDAPLIIQAKKTNKAVISGSDIWSEGWTLHADAIWTHDWPHNWGLSLKNSYGGGGGPQLPDLCRRRELLFVNGTALRQVLSFEQVVEGTFYVDEVGDCVYIWPPAGTNMTTAQVEVSIRKFGLLISGRKQVVVRGLVFEHANPFVDEEMGPLEFNKGCQHFLVEDCTMQWNNNKGLLVQPSVWPIQPASQNATFRRVKVLYSGVIGINIRYHKNLLVENCETSYSNFRGDWAGFYSGWHPAAFKMGHVHLSTWRQHTAIGNWGRGMWWDTDCSHVIAENCLLSENYLSGMFIENNPGPALVRHCIIQKTIDVPAVLSGNQGGLCISTTPDVTLENNVLYNNATRQFRIWDTVSRADNIDFETGVNYHSRVERQTYRHNAFYATNAHQLCVDIPDQTLFPFFYSTLLSNENLFYNPTRTDVFRTSQQNLSNPVLYDLAAWQQYTGQEQGSLFPASNIADQSNGNLRFKDQSPVARWNLPTTNR